MFNIDHELAMAVEAHYAPVDPDELENDLFEAAEYDQEFARRNQLEFISDEDFDDEYAPWEREDDQDDE